MKLSVFTVGLPEYDFATGIEKAKSWGFEGMEWRVGAPAPAVKPEDWTFERRYWSYNLCTVADNRLAADAALAAELTRKAGLTPVSLTSAFDVTQTAQVEELLAAAKHNGIPMVRVWTPWYRGDVNARTLMDTARRAMPVMEQLARESGVKICFETHMNNIAATCSMMALLLEGRDPDALGVIFDPGNMVFEGFENYQMGLEILGEYLAHVHVKNAITRQVGDNAAGGRRFETSWAMMDEGMADLERFFVTLRKQNYQGWLSVEDFTNDLTTDEKMTRTAAYLKKLLEVTHA